MNGGMMSSRWHVPLHDLSSPKLLLGPHRPPTSSTNTNHNKRNMAARGIVLEGLVDTPMAVDHGNEPMRASTAPRPTKSHALAHTELQDESAIQTQHGDGPIDLGWNTDVKEIARPLVGGMKNEDLWILIRRFNKVATRYFLWHTSTKYVHSKSSN